MSFTPLDTLIQKSKNNDVNAQFELGMRHYQGNGIAQDYKKAAGLFKAAAEQGHSEAQFQYGVRLAQGRGTEKNEPEAFKQFKLAAEQGHPAALYNCGVMLEQGLGTEKNEPEAFKQFQLAAEKGHSGAEYNCWVMLEQGRGTEKNGQKAFKQYPPSPVEPFLIMSEQDRAEAFKQYQLAAKQGDPIAQYNCGAMLEYGMGTEKNEPEAFKQYQLAAEQGHSEAQYRCGVMLEYGRGTEKNEPEAFKQYQLTAKQGNIVAQFTCGVRLEYGRGTEKNEQEAFKQYQLAAERGHHAAKERCRDMLEQGLGTEKNEQPVPLNLKTTPFQQKKQAVQESFLIKLNLLNSTLLKQAQGDATLLPEAIALHTGLTSALISLFVKITPKTSADEIQEHFKIFRQTCATHASKADAVMGHGWLFRAVEVLGKAIGALFVGLGMAVGSIFLQGLAKESHRNWYKETFFTLHDNEASKTIKSLDQNVDELHSNLKTLK